MRTGSMLFLGGILLLLCLAELPSAWWLLLLPLSLLLSIRFPPLRKLNWVLCGFGWALIHADVRLSQRLPPDLEGEALVIVGVVDSLPVYRSRRIRFDISANRVYDKNGNNLDIPLRVRLNWYQPYPAILPGQHWRLHVKLKRPYGFQNPGGFDYEKYLFQERIGATGYVLNNTENRLLGNPGHSINRYRLEIRNRLQHILAGNAERPLINALVTGDRSDMTPHQWQVLTSTGTSHLLAISGLHIGLVAGMVFLLLNWAWSCTGRLTEFIPAPRAAAAGSVAAALCYAALAGFSIPTQRALVMLGTVVVLSGIDHKVSFSHILAIAMLFVLVLDPFAVMSAGFWLSFLAISLIVLGMTCRVNIRGFWWRWGRVQWVVYAGLVPALSFWFGQLPVLGIAANLLAVPWVSLVTVPVTLAGIVILPVNSFLGELLIRLGTSSLTLLYNWLEWLIGLPIAVYSTAVTPTLSIVCAAIGVSVLLLPRGIPGRWSGLLWLLPLLLPADGELPPGTARVTVLDVGQGLSVLVETAGHTMLFDTGPRYSERFDAGGDIITPVLIHRGIKGIDVLVTSHTDSDHAGGLAGVMQNLEVDHVISSSQNIPGTHSPDACTAGTNWHWDSVKFSVLHPYAGDQLDKNNRSCVIQVSTGNQSILLTGDIELQAERLLVQRYSDSLQSTVIIVPHHGSKTSSTHPFIDAVNPKLAVFPVGYRNRFGLPNQDIINRYQERNVSVMDTASSGAIQVYFDDSKMSVSRYRNTHKHFWHTVYRPGWL